ncbi:hypothetical protein ACG904_20785 [Acinetobacter guillouiae]|uniref:hypothetical protein n=1 Tax=Acinetobacter guillouiae TaxID=106649 RepID=UPI003AF56D63
MHTLPPQDLKALQDFVLISAFMLSVFGFMALYFIYAILDRFLFKRIRMPKKIKTQYGYLFRTYSGIYVREEALLHKDLKCKAPLIEPNLRRNLGKWST